MLCTVAEHVFDWMPFRLSGGVVLAFLPLNQGIIIAVIYLTFVLWWTLWALRSYSSVYFEYPSGYAYV